MNGFGWFSRRDQQATYMPNTESTVVMARNRVTIIPTCITEFSQFRQAHKLY